MWNVKNNYWTFVLTYKLSWSLENKTHSRKPTVNDRQCYITLPCRPAAADHNLTKQSKNLLDNIPSVAKERPLIFVLLFFFLTFVGQFTFHHNLLYPKTIVPNVLPRAFRSPFFHCLLHVLYDYSILHHSQKTFVEIISFTLMHW